MDRVKYEQDYYQWTQAMVKALRERDYVNLDWDNLIDEIDDMGKSQKRAIESLLMRLTEHLLKLKYWRLRSSTRRVSTPRRRQAQGNARDEAEKTRNAKHWRSEVVNFRILLDKRLKDSPSLRANLEEIYEDIFPGCKRSVGQLFDLPEQAKLNLAEVLDENWFPDSQ
ncbi:MAG: DUF29 domain-containing protein [Xenococcus sp. (in: cyanobacteria)]